ncbi:MAG: hypothetical protein IPK13_03070 [Deltaproteobacteria bacterium]|nr:hypothetical protein [Deltaproteobacteria bacterium]
MPKRKALDLLERTIGAEYFRRDFVAVLFDTRFADFSALSSEAQAIEIEEFLGDALIAHIADPRGVLVEAEVGQSYDDDSRYRDIAKDDDALWVKVTADQPRANDALRIDDSDRAVEAILTWATHPKRVRLATAQRLFERTLARDWNTVRALLGDIPELASHAKTLAVAPRRRPSKKRKMPAWLVPMIPPKSRIVSFLELRGSRIAVREHRALRQDIFGDFFAERFDKHMPKASFADPKSTIRIAQFEPTQDLATTQQYLEKALAHLEPKVTRMKRTAAFLVEGQDPTLRVIAKYYSEDNDQDMEIDMDIGKDRDKVGRGRAYVTLVCLSFREDEDVRPAAGA